MIPVCVQFDIMLAAKHGARKPLFSIKKGGCGFIKGGWKLLESVFIRQRLNKNLLLLGTKDRCLPLFFYLFGHMSASPSLVVQKMSNLVLTITETV
jgi:hypothetical protein